MRAAAAPAEAPAPDPSATPLVREVDIVSGADSLREGLAGRSQTIGGVLDRLDRFALEIGDWRISAFDVLFVVAAILLVLAFALLATRLTRAGLRRVMPHDNVQRALAEKIATIVIWIATFLVGVDVLGIDLTALTVFSGAFGLAIGFGLQKTFGNLISGIILLMDKSIKPGDVISFTGTTGTSTENFGWVQELRGRYVVVRDRDGVETLVPNQNLITTSVINWSYSDQRVRLRLPVMISYQDDPEKALELLIEAAANHPRILRDPAPVSRLMSFEDYGMRLEARFWIRDPMNGVNNVRSDVNRAIWRLFKQAGITIPVSQQDVRVIASRDPRDAGAARPPGGVLGAD